MKENDIRSLSLLKESEQYYFKDMTNLQKRKAEFVKVSCPACDSDTYVGEFVKNGFNFDRCTNCETIFINPRATAKILDEFYKNSLFFKFWAQKIFPASEKVRREKIFVPRVNKIIELCRVKNISMNCLIEVGAGYGIFCQELNHRNQFDRIIAIEPAPDLANKCRSCGIDVIEAGIENVSLAEKSADVIVCFEVIEHIFSPIDFLKKCSNLIKGGGIIVLTCPNGKGFDHATLREKSQSFAFEHINYFNPKSMSILLDRCGFNTIEVETPGKLDAELVRKKILDNQYDISEQPFLKEVLLDRWDELGENFQQFLADNMLSSHMWIAGRKKSPNQML